MEIPGELTSTKKIAGGRGGEWAESDHSRMSDRSMGMDIHTSNTLFKVDQ